jgi:hypothetical protein
MYETDVAAHPLLGENPGAVWAGLVTVWVEQDDKPVADISVRLRDTQGVAMLWEGTTKREGEVRLRLPANETSIIEAFDWKRRGERKWTRAHPAPEARSPMPW